MEIRQEKYIKAIKEAFRIQNQDEMEGMLIEILDEVYEDGFTDGLNDTD